MELIYLTGILFASLAAVLWAVHNIIVRIATQKGTVADALVTVMAINCVTLLPITVVWYYPDYGLTRQSAVMFVIAGVLGLMLGRICLFEGIKAIGASRTTPVVSASTLVSTGLAVWFLDESLTAVHLFGIVCIVVGVAVISWVTASDADGETSLQAIGLSLLFPLGAAVFIGIEPIFVRIGLDAGTPILVGLSVMITAAFVSYLGYRRLRDGAVPIPRRSEQIRWYLAAGIASTVGLITYFAALEAAPVVIVIPIIQVSPLIVIALSAVFLPKRLEHITWRLVLAATVVVFGATIVSVSG